MEQNVLTPPIAFDSENIATQDQYETELREELAEARDAVARAYARERLGLLETDEKLTSHYNELTIQYGRKTLQDQLREVSDESERNALAIGFMVEEANRLSARVHDLTENNLVHRALRKTDEFFENGSNLSTKVKRIGATVLAVAAGKIVGGVAGAMAGAGLSVGVQEVAKLRYQSLGAVKVDGTLEDQLKGKSFSDVLEIAGTNVQSQLESKVSGDRDMSRSAFRRGLGKAGIAAALSGVGAGIADSWSGESAYASGYEDVGAEMGTTYEELPVTEQAYESVAVDEDSYLPAAVATETYVIPELEGSESITLVSDSSLEVSTELGMTDTETYSDANVESDEYEPVVVDTPEHEPIAVEPVEYVSLEVDTVGYEPLSVEDTASGEAVEVDSESNEHVSPGITVESDVDLPSVDTGEGLNEFVQENYGDTLTHDESMVLGEALHDQGFMYYDQAYLGEQYGNPYGINLPGEIDIETHETIQDMIDDGELNDSVGSDVEAENIENDTASDTEQTDNSEVDTANNHSPEPSDVDSSDAEQGSDSSDVQNEADVTPVEMSSAEMAIANQQIERLVQSGNYSLLSSFEMPGVDIGEIAQKFDGLYYDDGRPLVEFGNGSYEFNDQDGANLPKSAIDIINGYLEELGLNTYSYGNFNAASK